MEHCGYLVSKSCPTLYGTTDCILHCRQILYHWATREAYNGILFSHKKEWRTDMCYFFLPSPSFLALAFLTLWTPCSKYLEELLLRSCSATELSFCVRIFIVHITQLEREWDEERLLWQCLNQRRMLGKWSFFSTSTQSGWSGTKSLVQECLGDRGEREVWVSLWATETMGRRKELNLLVCLGFHDKIPSIGWL